MKIRNIFYTVLMLGFSPCSVLADELEEYETSETLTLTNSTQGPLWPPSEYTDENGDFILVGNVIKEVAPGVNGLVWEAVLVSKETIPPLNENGVEDFSNPVGAAYNVIRKLDLSTGSPDLDMVLYSLSFGPYSGNFGGGPRIPKIGDTTYNLNGAEPSCPELFPASELQATTYTRDRYPIAEVPVMGFQGDNIAYNAEQGIKEDPFYASGPGCGAGCSGENQVDVRNIEPYTLGKHLATQGKVKIELINWDGNLQAYTAAKFKFKFKHLPPKKVFSIWAIRTVVVLPPPLIRRPDPLGLPNVFVSDAHGNATVSIIVQNPFPDPASDTKGLRLIGLAVNLHSDEMVWGACPDRIGPGISIHNVFNDAFVGTPVAYFITKRSAE
ncbi:hypothetical protein MNBD_GAMMA21-1430 [hydrothermal vent metagenome]|uniref:Uncharacterized protein n=1 Tax=hydrothermal vent metagenome TaxID=652676 RepID=A0A3B0ZP67_9ZZZZ